MDHGSTPHFHNDAGYPRLNVGVREFMCIGALPPFDHPHIFIDMGDAADVVCPYCSTHYVFDAKLRGGVEPADCLFMPGVLPQPA